MKKFVERIALAIITLAAGFGTPAVMAGTASAAVTPVIYNYASVVAHRPSRAARWQRAARSAAVV